MYILTNHVSSTFPWRECLNRKEKPMSESMIELESKMCSGKNYFIRFKVL